MKQQLKEASENAAKFISKYPMWTDEVNDLLDLLESEILSGGSPDNELTHFMNDLEDLEKGILYGED